MAETPTAESMTDDRDSFGLQVAGGAHHLNNIFAQVLLNAELVDRSRLDETACGMLDSIVTGVHSAIRVVDTLAAQSTTAHGEELAINLKYLVKGLQKRREVLFSERCVLNAQYPSAVRLAWAKPAPLYAAVMALCHKAIEGGPERQSLFVQVSDVQGPDDEACVAIDVAAPSILVEAGLRAGQDPPSELSDIVALGRDSGATVEVAESETGGTLIRLRYPEPSKDR